MTAFPSNGDMDGLFTVMGLRSWCDDFKTLFDTYSAYINMWCNKRPAFTVTPYSFTDVSQIPSRYNAAWTRGSIDREQKSLINFVDYDHDIRAYGGFSVTGSNIYDGGGSSYNHTITVSFGVYNSGNRLRLQDCVNANAKMCVRCVPRSSGQPFTVECFTVSGNGGSFTFDAVSKGMVGGQYYDCYPVLKYGSTYYSLPGLTSNSIYINHYEAPAPTVTGVTIQGYSGAVNVGQSFTMHVYLTYSDGTTGSDDIAVANNWRGYESYFTLSGTGTFRADSPCSSVLIEYNYGGTWYTACYATANAVPVEPTVPTGISITNKPSGNLTVGNTHDLNYSLSPAADSSGYATYTVEWSRVSGSSNVSVNSSTGVVSATVAGSATIRATLKVGGATKDYDDYTVTFVAATVHVTGVALNKSTLQLNEGGLETLTATVSPSNATDQSVTWSSSNTNVATVRNGRVAAVTPGTATITVKTTDGAFEDECEVTVVAATVNVTGITLNHSSLSFTVGDSYQQLTATVSPSNATNKTVTWSSSNTSVATVNNGKVTPVGPGTCTITARATNGTSSTSDDYTATCSVTVAAASQDVAITGADIFQDGYSVIQRVELQQGGVMYFDAHYTPSDVTISTYRWTRGSSLITLQDGNSARCKVTGSSRSTGDVTLKLKVTDSLGNEEEDEITIRVTDQAM